MIYKLSKYFDSENFDEPIQRTSSDDYMPIPLYEQVSKIILINKNRIVLNDKYIPIGGSKIDYFYSLER